MFILKSRKWLCNNVYSRILFLVKILMYKYLYIHQKVTGKIPVKMLILVTSC